MKFIILLIAAKIVFISSVEIYKSIIVILIILKEITKTLNTKLYRVVTFTINIIYVFNIVVFMISFTFLNN